MASAKDLVKSHFGVKSWGIFNLLSPFNVIDIGWSLIHLINILDSLQNLRQALTLATLVLQEQLIHLA